jgi:phthalate 4,5-cis-dihydrodiol dehydrogenase
MTHNGESNTAPIAIAVVGLGLAGGVMVSTIKTHTAFRLAGATDLDDSLRARFTDIEGVPAHPSLEALLSDPAIEAVYIATPHQFHREHAVAALAAGKHVVVEKPMALNLEDCDAMIGAARQYDRQLIIGHTHGFDPCVQLMRQIIHGGRLGRIGMISTANYTDFLYRPRRPEELDTAAGGGILFNQLPHQIEMIRSLEPSPVRSVRAISLKLDRARPTEGGCMALIEFESDAGASIVYSGYDGFDSDEWHEWIGEGGFPKKAAQGAARHALRNVDVFAEIKLRRDRFGYGSGVSSGFPPAQPHFGTLVVTCERGDLQQCADGVRMYSEQGVELLVPPKTPWRPGRGDVLQELHDAIRNGQRPQHDGRFGRETLAVCLAIQRSAQQRREILFSNSPVGH